MHGQVRIDNDIHDGVSFWIVVPLVLLGRAGHDDGVGRGRICGSCADCFQQFFMQSFGLKLAQPTLLSAPLDVYWAGCGHLCICKKFEGLDTR
jgi:hypothetical protein